MRLRAATPDDATAIAAIHAPIVRETAISFELEPPSVDEMRDRIASTLPSLPWIVSLDDIGEVDGYAYASSHRERAAYRCLSIPRRTYARSAGAAASAGGCTAEPARYNCGRG